MNRPKISKRARIKRTEEIDKVLQVVDENEAAPTSITVKFKYSRGGETPDNINHLLHYASALGLDVVEGYGELVFHFGRPTVRK